MAKKKSIAKAFVGVTALAVAGKVVYDKYKILKEKFDKEENESICEEVKKYNAVCTSKSIEIEDEEFLGCEIKAVASKLLLDLSLAVFENDAYINFKSDASFVKIVLPEGINVSCDIDNVVSGIKNLVVNVDEEDIPTVFIIGKATVSNIEIIPANFYSDEDEFEDEDDFEDEEVKAQEDKAEEENAEEDKAKEVKEQEDKAEEDKAEEDKAEEDKAEEDKTEEDKTEEDKAEEDKVVEDKTEEDKAEEVKTEEVKTEEVKTEELKVEELNFEEVKAQENNNEIKAEEKAEVKYRIQGALKYEDKVNHETSYDELDINEIVL